jgi:hypothetical protein
MSNRAVNGVMTPPKRHPSRPLMFAVGAPVNPPRGLMSVEASTFGPFDVHVELRRLFWGAAIVLVLVLLLWHASSGR